MSSLKKGGEKFTMPLPKSGRRGWSGPSVFDTPSLGGNKTPSGFTEGQRRANRKPSPYMSTESRRWARPPYRHSPGRRSDRSRYPRGRDQHNRRWYSRGFKNSSHHSFGGSHHRRRSDRRPGPQTSAPASGYFTGDEKRASRATRRRFHSKSPPPSYAYRYPKALQCTPPRRTRSRSPGNSRDPLRLSPYWEDETYGGDRQAGTTARGNDRKGSDSRKGTSRTHNMRTDRQSASLTVRGDYRDDSKTAKINRWEGRRRFSRE